MFNLKQGAYPSVSIGEVQLPFNDADVGKQFTFTGVVKLDSIRPEGPVFNFDILKIGFPDIEGAGNIEGRKRTKMAAAGGVTVIINSGE